MSYLSLLQQKYDTLGFKLDPLSVIDSEPWDSSWVGHWFRTLRFELGRLLIPHPEIQAGLVIDSTPWDSSWVLYWFCYLRFKLGLYWFRIFLLILNANLRSYGIHKAQYWSNNYDTYMCGKGPFTVTETKSESDIKRFYLEFGYCIKSVTLIGKKYCHLRQKPRAKSATTLAGMFTKKTCFAIIISWTALSYVVLKCWNDDNLSIYL